MNKILCLLSVAAVALAAPQHYDASFGGDVSKMTKISTFSSGLNPSAVKDDFATGFKSADWRSGRELDGGVAQVTKITKITTEGADHAAAHSTFGAVGHDHDHDHVHTAFASGSMLPAARSAWKSESTKYSSGFSGMDSDAKLMAAAPSAWASDSKMMASGRSLWNSDAKMAASGRSAWESGSAHLVKDAHPAAEILMQEYEMPEPGNYKYSFKTADGIEAHEMGALKAEDAEAVQGVYSWVAPSGEKFAVEYVADETGYHAKGAHIPEMPRAIARSLEWNAAHPEEEDGRAASWDEYPKTTGKIGASSSWASSAKMGVASGRSAWVSDSSAALPAFESSAKIAPAMDASRFGYATGRSAWESHSALPAWEKNANLGSSNTKITETRTSSSGLNSGFVSGLDSGLSGRSAWNSDATGSSNFGGLSGTKITKITETKTVSSPSLVGSSFSSSGRSAWN